MAQICRADEREAYEEDEDYLEPQETRVVSGWQVPRADHSGGCPWRVEPRIRTYTAHDIESPRRDVGFFDAAFFVEVLRRINESIRTSPDSLRSLQEYESHELMSLMGSLREFLVEDNLGHSDELVSDYEPRTMYSLVDWRKINQDQWQTGIRATLGEDGETLAVWHGEIRAEHILEDEYEEFLPD